MLSYVLRTLKLGVKSLSLHALRSSLAMVGILIGVMAVIWLVALGEGVSDQAQKQIEQLGARNIIIKSVKPAASGTSGERTLVTIYGLTDADYDRLVEIIPTVERLTNKGGREIFCRCPTRTDADDTATWLVDRIGRLEPGLDLSPDVQEGGGQYLVALRG